VHLKRHAFRLGPPPRRIAARSDAQFERFLGATAPGADALYILGDLFEYWLGDDGLALPFNARIAKLLKIGIPTYFMHGNRDFLIAKRFSEETGIRLLEDPTVVDLYGERALLMHGDTLCTDDHEYQAFRKQVRDPRWQAGALAQPLAARIAIAKGMRAQSETSKEGKSMGIMDVALPAVEKAFAESGCKLMIHGHTHRPGRHVHDVNGQACVRWVLSDWYGPGSYLEATPEGIRSIPSPEDARAASAARITGSCFRVYASAAAITRRR
jgi:UDP-2,3-diacylglucosamine hydrolase